MVISYRSREKSVEVARHKALRAMNIAFGVLFVTVFFYAVSFTLAMGHDEAVKAYEQNISALAIAAQFISGDGAGWVKIVSVILNIFAVMTAFFGVYLGFREATQGIVMNILRRKMPAEKINENAVPARDYAVRHPAGLERDCIKCAGVELHVYLQPHFRHGGLPDPRMAGL